MKIIPKRIFTILNNTTIKILVAFFLVWFGIVFFSVVFEDKERTCLETGYCPEGFRFYSCDWEAECIVNEHTCKGRGKWNSKKRTCNIM